MWQHAFYLAWCYLRAMPRRSGVMVFAVAIAVFLPAVSWQIGVVLEDAMLARASATPIVVGHKGDEFDLVFQDPRPPMMRHIHGFITPYQVSSL